MGSNDYYLIFPILYIFFIIQYFVCYLRDIYCLIDGKRKFLFLEIYYSLTCVYFSKKIPYLPLFPLS